ncbi:biotin transporter BioY [Pengzhenrongella frigida]|uniref:Biotin transporter n=1 Tax=Pengzhenrongella frigida TaxID=1259133 RepID=A0A4Q5MY11_9MICO|nr:biotin transporter BioY [Cellulomonas sp. HLT2-17]RYV50545.1 biotin transporter BioY [Cellulomonas sp. HLT2-17]
MSTAPQNEPRTSPTPSGAVALPSVGARGRARSGTTTDVALVATFAAFIAVCALLPSIPVAGIPVPITLQTFGVLLAGVVLGPRRGAAAVGLYLAVGLAGMPVFAQATGGLAVVAKPSFGYLIAFPLAAALAGYVASLARRVRPALRPFVLFGAAMSGSLVFIHPIGIAVMGWRLDLDPGAAIALGATFVPGDVIKNMLVAVVAAAIFRAFPDMLRVRR